jgi:hypothetical protein
VIVFYLFTFSFLRCSLALSRSFIPRNILINALSHVLSLNTSLNLLRFTAIILNQLCCSDGSQALTTFAVPLVFEGNRLPVWTIGKYQLPPNTCARKEQVTICLRESKLNAEAIGFRVNFFISDLDACNYREDFEGTPVVYDIADHGWKRVVMGWITGGIAFSTFDGQQLFSIGSWRVLEGQNDYLHLPEIRPFAIPIAWHTMHDSASAMLKISTYNAVHAENLNAACIALLQNPARMAAINGIPGGVDALIEVAFFARTCVAVQRVKTIQAPITAANLQTYRDSLELFECKFLIIFLIE